MIPKNSQWSGKSNLRKGKKKVLIGKDGVHCISARRKIDLQQL